MKILIDAMGGDNAPGEIVKGALMAHSEFGCDIVIVGSGERILQILHEEGISEIPKGMEIVNASQVVEMDDSPATVTRDKPDSSMIQALNLLAKGEGDAIVSAGNTGALLSASTLIVKRIKGIRRASLAPIIPTVKGNALLIDGGANVDCNPEYLLQFAYMGAFCAKRVLGMESPRVGLLNIGGESNKGDELRVETYKLLEHESAGGRLNFVGNIEGRDVVFGAADVIVADGFSGNVFLKTLEGMGLFFADHLKAMFSKNMMSKLAYLAIKPSVLDLKKILDYNETGGAPLLGVGRPVVKAHGSSKAYTIRSAVKQAINLAETRLVSEIIDNIDFMKVNE